MIIHAAQATKLADASPEAIDQATQAFDRAIADDHSALDAIDFRSVPRPTTTNVCSFALPLAFDAFGGVGDNLQPGDGDDFATTVATAIRTVSHPQQGIIDLAQFAALDLSQLTAQFVAGCVRGGVENVAMALLPQFVE